MAKRRERGTGTVRQLNSGRWQARFAGPDGLMRPAPQTFDTKLDATAWLKSQASDVERGMWAAPNLADYGPAPLLRDYASQWLADRDLTPKTKLEYRKLLDQHIVPKLGDARIDRITPTTVRTWYATLDKNTPTRRAHAYSLLRTILNSAYAEDKIDANPCRIRGAGQSPEKQVEVEMASLDELVLITNAMPERLRLMVVLAAWCALRYGELTELRRKDIDLKKATVQVRRGVTFVPGPEKYHAGIYVIGDPKTEAGKRKLKIPSHLMPMVRAHLMNHVEARQDALLFPAVGGGNLPHSSFRASWRPARLAAERPDLRFHDLRHTGAVLAALSGATLAELMFRLGHTTPAAALRYQHVADGRDEVVADDMSRLTRGGKVMPMSKGAAARRRRPPKSDAG